MGFFLFLLVTATLLIRPAEQFQELRGARLYEAVIILCFVFSLGSVLEQFTINNLESRPITLCLFGMLLAVVLSLLAQGKVDQAGEYGFEFFKIVVYYVLLVANVTTVGRLRVFVLALGCCAVVFVTLAVLQYHEVIKLPEPEVVVVADAEQAKKQEADKNAFVKDYEYDAETGRTVEFKRLRGTGIFRDPNDLSLLLTMGLFIALYGFTDLQLGVFRLAWLGAIGFFVYALALTQSRGGLLGMLTGFMALFYGRYGWRGMALLGVPLVPVALVFFGGRMASLSTSEGTGQTRIQIWSDTLDTFRSAPLFGVGLHELGAQTGKAAHNSFLEAYADLGLFGGTCFLGAFFCAVVALQRGVRWRQALPHAELGRMVPYLLAVVAAYVVGILSLSRVEAVPTYLLLGLVAAFAGLAASRRPVFALKVDSRLAQQMALASAAFLAVAYVFVRVFKA
jgi:hypothetical protein